MFESFLISVKGSQDMRDVNLLVKVIIIYTAYTYFLQEPLKLTCANNFFRKQVQPFKIDAMKSST